MDGKKKCSACKKEVKNEQDAVFLHSDGFMHRKCFEQKSGLPPKLGKAMSPLYTKQMWAFKSNALLAIVVLGFCSVGLLGIGLFGLFLNNWVLAGQLMLLAIFAIVLLGPLAYSFYAFHKDS